MAAFLDLSADDKLLSSSEPWEFRHNYISFSRISKTFEATVYVGMLNTLYTALTN